MPPPAREIGDARHAREGDDAAVFGADAELALSLERRACHRLEYVAGAGPRASAPSRARVIITCGFPKKLVWRDQLFVGHGLPKAP